MTATLALLVDAYRELNAKRLFWVVLTLSGLVVASFAAVGLGPNAVTVFGWETPLQFGTNLFTKAAFYKLMFYTLGVELWLTWAAMILAVISTAGIFPDFLAGGSVDLYLSRPLRRLRLFLVKYACGLLFVTLQVSAFSLAGFLVIGLRGGAWEPGLFLAVPLVVLMFSYLFSVSVLVGVLTRSTVAALLLTVLFWLALWAAHTAEVGLLTAEVADQRATVRLDRQIELVEDQLNDLDASPHGATRPAVPLAPAPPPAAPPPAERPALLSRRPASRPADDAPFGRWLGQWVGAALSAPPPTPREKLEARLSALRHDRAVMTHPFGLAHRIAYWVVAPLPKTSETIALLERKLVAAADLPHPPADDEAPTDDANGPRFHPRRRDHGAAAATTRNDLRQRPLSWVIGTSLAFEAVVVGLAAWIFCRRDY